MLQVAHFGLRSLLEPMFNTDDPQTLASLSRLKRLVSGGKKPVVFWVGAGASLWAGYPSWESVAKGIRRVFAFEVAAFDNSGAVAALSSGNYPKVFEICKAADATRYYAFLVDTFAKQPHTTALYQRFVDKIKVMEPHLIVTTNVDLALEQSLSSIDVIERTDCERISLSIAEARNFVAKLHGSISSVFSVVFASSEYEELKINKTFLPSMRALFEFATVIFLGYGVRDEYVVNLLLEDRESHKLFGSGPHFILTTSLSARSDGLHRIAYSTSKDADHRASLYVLDIVQQARSSPAPSPMTDYAPRSDGSRETAIYISQFFPPGTYQSSQTAIFGNKEKSAVGQVAVGLGFVEGEIPDTVSRAFHDLLVGLLCFDKVYLPIDAIPRLNTAFPQLFNTLIDDGSIHFVHTMSQPAVVGTPAALFGSVSTITIREGQADSSVQIGPTSKTPMSPRKVETVVRKMIHAAPGAEAAFEVQLEKILKLSVVIDEAIIAVVPARTRSSLIMPSVAALIGLNDSVLPSEVPAWLTFPVLRLAHLVETSIICAELGVQAVRIPYGGKALINATFGLQSALESADTAANYVLSGRLGTNLGQVVHSDPSVLLRVLKFRNTPEARNLRVEISDRLSVEVGSGFQAAIDAGLARTVSPAIVEKARDRMNQLAGADGRTIATPAVWFDSSAGDKTLVLWRARSAVLFREIMQKSGLTKDSACICGSQEKIRNCCLRMLR